MPDNFIGSCEYMKLIRQWDYNTKSLDYRFKDYLCNLSEIDGFCFGGPSAEIALVYVDDFYFSAITQDNIIKMQIAFWKTQCSQFKKQH